MTEDKEYDEAIRTLTTYGYSAAEATALADTAKYELEYGTNAKPTPVRPLIERLRDPDINVRFIGSSVEALELAAKLELLEQLTKPPVIRPCFSKREIYGEEFYAWVQGVYDESRRYLKTCGKPVSAKDRYCIDFHKFNSKHYGAIL